MKRDDRNLNLEKETEHTSKKTSDKTSPHKKPRSKSSQNTSTETIQHPKKVGFHGTDDEKDLNPEE
jgi:hypothetical protein